MLYKIKSLKFEKSNNLMFNYVSKKHKILKSNKQL